MSLFLVLLAAKIAGGHTGWSPAYFWQDAAVALALLVAERRRALYWTVAVYAAINVPVVRAVGTPLTGPMLRAARGPLADSMRHYVNWPNAAAVALVLAVAAVAPLVLVRVRQRWAACGLAAIVAVGLAAPGVPGGLGRNAWTALIPRMAPRSGTEEWRATGFGGERSDELLRFRGQAAGRNVVMVSLESTAAQYLGLYGASPDPTPNLSALARHAIMFDNAYAVYPESIKGLFSILCSEYPAFDSAAEEYAQAPCRSVAGALGAAGYRTALFHSGRFGYLGMDAVIRNRGFSLLEDAGDIGGVRESSFGVDEPSTVARILRWIDALPKGQRFFVTYLPIAGHHPYETPRAGPFDDRTDFGRYRNALRYGDESLGALMHGLAERGLGDRTLWIVMGDHGEAFGQHEGNFGHTFAVYEENVHVPLLAAAPGLIEGTVRHNAVVSLIDVAPTLLDLAGVRAPDGYQGRSALAGEPRMALFFADYSMGMLGLRDGSRKFIYEIESRRGRLYDLDRDPGERRDVAAAFPAPARWYAQDLRSWSAAQRTRLRAAGIQ
jgi:hypothetical protein